MCPINLRALSMYNTNKLLMRIYPNIDVVFSIPKTKTVEYNFVVHPKGKISDIQLKFVEPKQDN
jgi:hypothetical protein